MAADIDSPDHDSNAASRIDYEQAGSTSRPHVESHLKDNPAIIMLCLLSLAIVAGVLFPLTTVLSAQQDGDGVLTALISIQKLTWYFWGQDRFLNFIPALASVIPDIELNLRFQIFLRAFFAFLAPLGVLVFISRSPRFLLTAVVITHAILIAALDQEALFNFYVQHNPFGTSMVLFALAWLSSDASQQRVWLTPVTLALCAIAYAVNLALLIFSAPLIVYLLVTRKSERSSVLMFGVLNGCAVVLAFVHSKIFGEASTTFAIAPSVDALVRGVGEISAHVNSMSIAVVAVIALMVLRIHRMTCKRDLLALVAIAAAMVVLLANLGWVQQNLSNIRYFLLAILVLASVLAIVIASALVQAKIVYPVALIVFAACIGFGLKGYSESFAQMLQSKWESDSVAVGELAKEDGARIIIGDFWDVWPAVFQASTSRSRSEIAITPVFGGTFRGHVLREKFLADTVDKGEQAGLCFLPDVDACVKQLRKGLALPANVRIAVRKVGNAVAGSKNLLQMSFIVTLAD